MDKSLVGLVGIIVVVLIAEASSVCLRRPLGLLLRSEKGAERSDFWNAYVRVILLLVPAFFALVSFPSDALVNPTQAFVGELRWGIAGLLIALAFAAKGLHIPAPSRRTAPYVPPTTPPVSAGPAR